MRRLVTVLAGVLVGWLMAFTPAVAVAPAPHVITYSYDATATPTTSVDAHMERGPPNATFEYGA